MPELNIVVVVPGRLPIYSFCAPNMVYMGREVGPGCRGKPGPAPWLWLERLVPVMAASLVPVGPARLVPVMGGRLVPVARGNQDLPPSSGCEVSLSGLSRFSPVMEMHGTQVHAVDP